MLPPVIAWPLQCTVHAKRKSRFLCLFAHLRGPELDAMRTSSRKRESAGGRLGRLGFRDVALFGLQRSGTIDVDLAEVLGRHIDTAVHVDRDPGPQPVA